MAGFGLVMGDTDIAKEMRQKKEPNFLFADTEADARAKMLIYLVENKLVTF